MNRLKYCLYVLSCLLITASCTGGSHGAIDPKKKDVLDPDIGLTRGDYLNPYSPKGTDPAKEQPSLEPPVPDLAEVLAAPQPPKLGETKLVSIAVTDDVPLKDVFIELSRMADVDVEVDSGITGGVSFRAKDRPFNEVVDRLADMAGLRYKMTKGVLRIERDTPYLQDYPINFLNLDRTTNGSFSVSSGGTSSSGSGGSSSSGSSSSSSGGPTTGSADSVSSKSETDFWKQFEATVKQILAYSPANRAILSGNGTQPEAPAAAAAAAGAADAVSSGGGFYIMNRQASTLTVSATSKQHEMLRQFLRIVDANTSSQVLIEAKVLEVTLNDTYQSGINWKNFGTNNISFSGNLDNVNSTAVPAVPTLTVLKNGLIGGADLSAAVNLLEEFGTTRALSSPRLNAMNNQRAVLSFVEGLVYFTVKVSTSDPVLGANNVVTTPGKVDVSSTQNTVPVGIVLSLLPVIDSKDNDITLDVHPTLTRQTKTVLDPGFEVSKANAIATLASSNASASVIAQLSGIKSNVPQIETRELDSIIKVKSGQTLVIGGLLEDSVANDDAGVPGADEVPWFGNLFKSVSKTNSKKELVIFLRATIIPPAGAANKADRNIYEKFSNDPRPLNFGQ